MVGIGNNNGVEQRLEFYYNDNGVIKSIDDYDVLIERDGSVIKFPQKQNCLVNLDFRSWLLSSVDKSNSFITNRLSFSSQNQVKTDWGTLTQSLPTSGGSFQVSKGNYLYIPNSYLNNIDWGQNVFANQQFTIALTFKHFGAPTDWRNLTWFNNANGFRFEWNGGGYISIFAEGNFISGNKDFPRLPSYTNDWVQLIMVVDGVNRTLKGYQNGLLGIDSTLTSGINTSSGTAMRLFSQRGATATNTYGCPVALRDLQVWKTALTPQEVADLRKFLYLD